MWYNGVHGTIAAEQKREKERREGNLIQTPARRTILTLLAVALACLLAVPALPLRALQAQDQPPAAVQMGVRAAFGGHFKYGEWLPLWIELENGGPDLDAEVQVRLAGGGGTTTFAAPAPLPNGARKRIALYVLPNNYSHELEVQLVAGDEVLQAGTVDVEPQPNLTYIVGLATADRGALSLLSAVSLPGQRRPIRLVDVALADLPARPEGLASFDCLILNDVDTSALSPEQGTALRAWVGRGGRLVVGGGAGAARTAAGLDEALLPAVPQGNVTLDALPGLASLAGGEAIRVPGPFLAARGRAVAGAVLAQEGDLPLVRERAVGAGYVDWAALDLAVSPFDAWAGTVPFWERLLAAGAAYPTWLPSDMSPRQVQASQLSYALGNLPGLDLPSVQGLALLLGAYILIVGPLNYLLLRWRRRLHWAWITIPLLTVLFSAGTFGLGYALRGSDLLVNKITILDLPGDGTAYVRGYVGLFSPSQQAYEVQIEGDPLLSPMNRDSDPWGRGTVAGGRGELALLQSRPAAVRGLAVDQWSIQGLLAETIWPDAGRIAADLRIDGQGLSGEVRNETAYHLADAVLIQGSQFLRLGDLAPGQSAAVDLDLTAAGAQAFGPPLSYRLFEEAFARPGVDGPARDVQVKQSIVDSLFQQGGKFAAASLSGQGGGVQGPLLLGWLDEAPPRVTVAGRAPNQDTTGLLYAPLAYRLPEEGPVTLPPGLIPGALVEMPVEGGLCGPAGATAIYVGRGQAVLEFQVPDLGQMDVERLDLSLGNDGGWWQSPDLAVYDWSSMAWRPVEGTMPGLNPISPAGNLLSADGRVRIRLAFAQGGGGCIYVDLGLAGTRLAAAREPGP
ncbi:MAG: hypothetical protein P8129_17865 [Anaerolineae bacterium]